MLILQFYKGHAHWFPSRSRTHSDLLMTTIVLFRSFNQQNKIPFFPLSHPQDTDFGDFRHSAESLFQSLKPKIKCMDTTNVSRVWTPHRHWQAGRLGLQLRPPPSLDELLFLLNVIPFLQTRQPHVSLRNCLLSSCATQNPPESMKGNIEAVRTSPLMM